VSAVREMDGNGQGRNRSRNIGPDTILELERLLTCLYAAGAAIEPKIKIARDISGVWPVAAMGTWGINWSMRATSN